MTPAGFSRTTRTHECLEKYLLLTRSQIELTPRKLTPPKNGYWLSNCCRGKPLILDSCSSSQIHLWSKSQISNRVSREFSLFKRPTEAGYNSIGSLSCTVRVNGAKGMLTLRQNGLLQLKLDLTNTVSYTHLTLPTNREV